MVLWGVFFAGCVLGGVVLGGGVCLWRAVGPGVDGAGLVFWRVGLREWAVRAVRCGFWGSGWGRGGSCKWAGVVRLCGVVPWWGWLVSGGVLGVGVSLGSRGAGCVGAGGLGLGLVW